jgi:enediyne biosynthesis protein E5
MTTTPSPTREVVAPRPGLRPFAISITILNILGYTWLGFEPAPIVPFIALAAAYSAEMAVELSFRGWSGARFRGGWRNLVNFLLASHISGLAVSMLLFTNENFFAVAFASSLAIYSKVLFRAPVPGTKSQTIHYMNPSNLGIAATIVLFYESVNVLPYQFTENVHGPLDWLLPAIVICTGSFLNIKATKKWPVFAAWVVGYIGQAVVRSFLSPQPLVFLLAPLTGFALIVFTFYMITDPATTPATKKGQAIFGFSTAALYGALSYAGVVYGVFFALCIVCAARGAWLWVESARQARAPASVPVMRPAA